MPVEKADHDRDAKQTERDRELQETLDTLSVPVVSLPRNFRFSREEANQRGRDLPQELSVVLRFPGVTSTRQQFEASLGRAVDRFEPVRDEFYYAQINLQEGATWPEFIRLIEDIGPAVQVCLQRGEVGQPYADFCVSIVEGMAGECFRMPSSAARAIARWGFDLEVSTYLTSEH